MSVIYILWLREVKKYLRSRAQIIASLGQPLLYLLALGFGLGPVFEKAGQGSYLQFVAPATDQYFFRVVNLGPGATRYAHAQDERVEIEALQLTYEALSRFGADM